MMNNEDVTYAINQLITLPEGCTFHVAEIEDAPDKWLIYWRMHSSVNKPMELSLEVPAGVPNTFANQFEHSMRRYMFSSGDKILSTLDWPAILRPAYEGTMTHKAINMIPGTLVREWLVLGPENAAAQEYAKTHEFNTSDTWLRCAGDVDRYASCAWIILRFLDHVFSHMFISENYFPFILGFPQPGQLVTILVPGVAPENKKPRVRLTLGYPPRSLADVTDINVWYNMYPKGIPKTLETIITAHSNVLMSWLMRW